MQQAHLPPDLVKALQMLIAAQQEFFLQIEPFEESFGGRVNARGIDRCITNLRNILKTYTPQPQAQERRP